MQTSSSSTMIGETEQNQQNESTGMFRRTLSGRKSAIAARKLIQDSVDETMDKEPSRQLKRSLPQSSNQNTASLSHIQSKSNGFSMTRFTMEQIKLVIKLYEDKIY